MFRNVFIFCIFATSFPCSAQGFPITPSTAPTPTVVNIVSPTSPKDPTHQYFKSILLEALNITKGQYGPAKLIESGSDLVQQRAMQKLSIGDGLDVFWTVTNKAREEQALPVRVPLLKGLFGYRVAFIHKDNVEKFSALSDETTLKQLVAGQGHDWPDLRILQNNGYRTLSISNYDSLIDMLIKKRIDYFPRGVGEILQEAEIFQSDDVQIEESFILFYPSYVYFFVNPNKPKLAERIHVGLLKMREAGTFAKYFSDYIDINELKNKLNLQNRKIYFLKNEDVTEHNEYDITPFWMDN